MAISSVLKKKVAARGVHTASQVLPADAYATMTTGSIPIDTHNALATSGVFTSPVKTTYKVSWQFACISSAIWTTSQEIYSRIIKNGAEYALGSYHETEAAFTGRISASGDCIIEMDVNDTLAIQPRINRGGNNTTIDNTFCYIDIIEQ